MKPTLTTVVAIVLAVFLAVAGVAVFLMAHPEPSVTAQHQCHAKFRSACAPCTCISALSYFGIKATQYDMVTLCGTTIVDGTTPSKVVFAMATSGASCTPVAPSVAVTPGTVCIVGYTRTTGERHCVCLYGDGTGCVVNDSAEDDPLYWSATQVAACNWIYRVQPLWKAH